ncbi:MAG: mannose-6-phosphate isomerase, class I [Deltaproteobacteria bacterium]|nr:mannose-6-phosphate isomerase, class I [Deltaproteobacteria bacterium]
MAIIIISISMTQNITRFFSRMDIKVETMIKPSILKNKIQEYAWGSFSHIQQLLGAKGKAGTPWAELWMGAHPKAPSEIKINGSWAPLDMVIEKNPEATVGKTTCGKFGPALPFLFKALAAGRPLSIQAHPDEAQAKEGFERENRLKIPIDAPFRNYRDDRHKPECICALTPFTAINGFRASETILSAISSICPETLGDKISRAGRMPEEDAIRFIFEFLLRIEDDLRKKVISETIATATQADTVEKKWILQLHEQYPDDIGILSPVILNLVTLQPGEAMFLPARRLHAYFDGFGIELMANSDNVLRGGLTPKHIDVDELLNVLDFSPAPIEILHPMETGTCERPYPVMAEEFRLSVIKPEPIKPEPIKPGQACSFSNSSGPEILFCVEKECLLEFPEPLLPAWIHKGDSVFIPACVMNYNISGTGQIYRAQVP